MAKITYLNVDDLAPIKKTMTLLGVTYQMHQVNVGEFINLIGTNDEVTQDEFEALSMAEKIKKLVKQIQTAFPDIPESALQSLTMEQLLAVVRFVAGTLEEEAQARALVDEQEEGVKNA